MAFHDYVRATGDIDLWIRRSVENAQKVWRALENFGAPLFDLKTTDLTTPEMVFQIGVVPTRIDIITSIDGVDFDEAWQDKATVRINNLNIPVLSKAHMIQNKRSSNRPKDRIDLLWLTSEDKPE